MKPIGILGGTFDPIHEGHLAIAHEVHHALQLDYIMFIPCFSPPHREKPIASPTDRLAMLTLAIKNYPQFQLNPLEMQRKGMSYSIDTLLQLRQEMPQQSLCFILGADAFSQFNQWHEWERICDLVHLIVVTRPKVVLPQAEWLNTLLLQRKIEDTRELQTAPAGKIYFQPIQPIAVSATQIRQDIASGKKKGAGLTPEVENYIVERGVYCSFGGQEKGSA